MLFHLKKISKMKAKEYFEKYINENQDKSKEWRIVQTLRDIFCEAEVIAKNRNVTTDAGYQSIFKELNDKANSFCKAVNQIDDMELKHDAFKLFIKSENKNLYKMLFPNEL